MMSNFISLLLAVFVRSTMTLFLILLINNFTRIIVVVLNTFALKILWASFTRLIEVEWLGLCCIFIFVFEFLVFCSSNFVSMWLFYIKSFRISLLNWWLFTVLSRWCQIFWLCWFLRWFSTLNTSWSTIRCYCFNLWRSWNCLCVRYWSRLWTRILLLFLVFVELRTFQTAIYIFLNLLMMSSDLLWKIYSFFNWDYFSQGIYFLCVLLISRRLVTPPENFFIWFIFLHIAILNYLTHLCVQECISYDHFFIL